MTRPFWSAHTHSRHSAGDALSHVDDLVGEAAALDYPALGLTDHGTPGGNLELYKACRRQGMEPLPGVELYVTPDREMKIQGHNLHLTVNAYSETGYRNLCRLVTLTSQNFHYKPRVDLADLAALADSGGTRGLSVATGCWFGLLPTVMREQGPAAAEQLAKTLAGWFPRVYIELQAHGIDPESQTGDAAWLVEDRWATQASGLDVPVMVAQGEYEMIDALLDVSARTGIPHIITTDAHYTRPEDQEVHDGLKLLCSWSEDPSEAVFPGGPYSLFGREELEKYFTDTVIDRSIEALSELAEVAHVRLPELENFRMLVPDVTRTGDADRELRDLVMERLAAIDEPEARHKRRRTRVIGELDVIEQTNFASYILLIASIAVHMREEAVVFNTRGSANDSEVCWLAGITNVSAFDWDLRFERFISIDRIKPPDVDFDIEHERRDEITAWAATQFTVCQVGTLMKYSLFDEEEDEGKGSLRVRYFATMRKSGKPVKDWRDIPDEDKAMLKELGSRKLISGYGTHPAGLILAPDAASIADLPMVRIGSGSRAHLVTAYDKDGVEDLGFIKGDFLGLRTLTAVAIATRLIMEDEQIEGVSPMEYLETIPLNDRVVYRRIGDGRTEGAFQLQERPATDFVQRMKPTTINDIVAAMALMRPAAKGSGTTGSYLARRKKVQPVPAMHDDLLAETKKTYGLLVYQEQVIGALRAIRMEMGELNKLLKAVKASNEYVAGAKVAIQQALPRIRELAGVRGWSEDDIEILVDAVSGYADYGFNEAHAVAYGKLAYQTAWIAEYFPAQWWTGILTAYSNHDNEPRYVRAARRFGVRIVPPDINASGHRYTYDRGLLAVRRGLLSVHGVGEVAARELVDKQPFASLKDLGERVAPRRVSGAKQLALGKPLPECTGVIAALYEAGALDSLDRETVSGG